MGFHWISKTKRETLNPISLGPFKQDTNFREGLQIEFERHKLELFQSLLGITRQHEPIGTKISAAIREVSGEAVTKCPATEIFFKSYSI